MNLTLTAEYKSLQPFTQSFPDFVILTGINGAGKTQLLTGITSNNIKVTDENGQELLTKAFASPQTLSPSDAHPVTQDQLLVPIKDLINEYQNYLNQKVLNPGREMDYILNGKSLRKIEAIAKDAKKDIDKLNSNDFFSYYPVKDELVNSDVFYSQFAMLFKRYQVRFDNNNYNKYRNEVMKIQNINFLTDDEFGLKYGGPPWEFVNKILSSANFGYHINSPAGDHRDAEFGLRLVDNVNGTEILFAELSSGEKVLMSLALAMYNSNSEMAFRQILLMDEPDASLHPLMSKQFLDVIQQVFVAEKKVKVIITTHSPSTVAFAPEDAIFIVNKKGNRFEKAGKDKALKNLTSGVPSFSVNYENRRQVFVESFNDVSFYERLYLRLSDYLTPEISLTFIASGDSRTDKNGVKVSNCQQVKDIVNALRKAGNRFVWGIVDWDKSNKGSEFIKVLGDGNRYNIENYLFDPILVAALLIREKKEIKREDLGMAAGETYVDFSKYNSARLQEISDFIIEKVRLEVNLTDDNISEVQLLNKITIKIPTWYLHYPGHEVEAVLLKVFPSLNDIKRKKEELLKDAILNKVIDDLPDLISHDILEVFRGLQEI